MNNTTSPLKVLCVASVIAAFSISVFSGTKGQNEEGRVPYEVIEVVDGLLSIAGRTRDDLLPKKGVIDAVTTLSETTEGPFVLQSYYFKLKDEKADPYSSTDITVDQKMRLRRIDSSPFLFKGIQTPRPNAYWEETLKKSRLGQDIETLLGNKEVLFVNDLITTLSVTLAGVSSSMIREMESRYWIRDTGQFGIFLKLLFHRKMNGILFEDDTIYASFILPSLKLSALHIDTFSNVIGPTKPTILAEKAKRLASEFASPLLFKDSNVEPEGEHSIIIKQCDLYYSCPEKIGFPNPKHPYWTAKYEEGGAMLVWKVGMDVSIRYRGKENIYSEGKIYVYIDPTSGVPLGYKDLRHTVIR